MKNSHLFWGILFISLGILVLLNNFTTFTLDWSFLWKMWPLVLVLWGLVLIAKNNLVKGFLITITALIFAFTIFAAFKTTFSFVHDGFAFDINDDEDYEVINYSEPFNDSIKEANFYLRGGAGKLIINGTTGELFSAVSRGIKDNYKLTYNNYDSTANLNFEMKETRFHFNDGNMHNRVEMKLNSEPVWDMDYEVGAASVDFDLTPFKIEKLKMKAGAASVKIRVGTLSDIVNLYFNAGAAKLDIEVPESSGCEIRTKAPLSIKDFDDFDKVESGLYHSPNYSDSVKKIYIEIDAGVSSINVSRYSDWESAAL